MFEKTTAEIITEEVHVWAIPRTKWEIEQSEDGCPFEYVIRLTEPYQDGAIKLHTAEVIVSLPEGIPLLDKAIETLKEAIDTERKNSRERVEAMQKQIDTLALIEYQPEPEPDDSMDGDFDTAMASAGHGTDEDYGGGMERL